MRIVRSTVFSYSVKLERSRWQLVFVWLAFSTFPFFCYLNWVLPTLIITMKTFGLVNPRAQCKRNPRVITKVSMMKKKQKQKKLQDKILMPPLLLLSSSCARYRFLSTMTWMFKMTSCLIDFADASFLIFFNAFFLSQ